MADDDSIDQRLDALLDELPEGAATVDLDPDADYQVCTITIDWRLVPGLEASRLRLVRGWRDDG